MQTGFSPRQLADPAMAQSEQILRKCVHCGFCTATCPTFVTLGDELDSPRGRIYLIKDMLENDKPATERVVRHLDRCLSCLSCTTTCPSGVDYMHLIDHARAHIEKTYQRPAADKWLRKLLAWIVPRPTLFRVALMGARLASPLAGLMPGRLRGMVKMGARPLPPPSWVDRPQVIPAQGARKGRVAILTGCAQQVLETEINEATVRLLTRLGIEIVVAKGAGCCGSLVHHMGKEDASHAQAINNIAAWHTELSDAGGEGLDAIVITASGCGTTVKDYGNMLAHDAVWAQKAARIAGLACDITEYLTKIDLPAGLVQPVVLSPAAANQHAMPTPARDSAFSHSAAPSPAPASVSDRAAAATHNDMVAGTAPGGRAPVPIRVAYHSACSMQHGQKINRPPRDLLRKAGFEVLEIGEGHLCCGSAGVYNLLQPEIAGQLKERKQANIRHTRPDLVATGNIGCMIQLETDDLKVVHTVQLLDWATGGPCPAKLQGHAGERA
ncbi:heterodisulfide reductase-related iron-sulfur binding cluster [Thalassospira mesophila]|uniref:2-hydroxy-acid oxidase n=1 Tax=Thalassospira mesophila TaxID=1293891 RepID=A0A1Y2L4J8_9PROT|nr:heterodisulfide reductase-related iron-sulfur binding cluster [Thalassospira mesophila]OSQ40732.1 2-hydroxy-acid oxidase [Thalassospira mesophila]